MAAVSQLFDVLTPVAVVKGFGSYRGEDDEYQPKRRAKVPKSGSGSLLTVATLKSGNKVTVTTVRGTTISISGNFELDLIEKGQVT
eukprot:scaffold249353_cov82-Cyclotella_meneghiniana.AAC.12